MGTLIGWCGGIFSAPQKVRHPSAHWRGTALFKTTLLHFDELRYCQAGTPHHGSTVSRKAVAPNTP